MMHYNSPEKVQKSPISIWTETGFRFCVCERFLNKRPPMGILMHKHLMKHQKIGLGRQTPEAPKKICKGERADANFFERGGCGCLFKTETRVEKHWSLAATLGMYIHHKITFIILKRIIIFYTVEKMLKYSCTFSRM